MDVSPRVALEVRSPTFLWAETEAQRVQKPDISSFNIALTQHCLFVILGDSKNAKKKNPTFPAFEEFLAKGHVVGECSATIGI